MIARVGIAVALFVILGVPFALSLGGADGHRVSADAPRVIVVTPHVQQIQEEFATAFNDWHQRQFGTEIVLDYRSPGGTSEIRKQLEAQFNAALKDDRFGVETDGDGEIVITMEPGTIQYDIFFGGGSFDHGMTAVGVPLKLGSDDSPTGEEVRVMVPMSDPAGFTQDQLDEWYGENRVGTQKLYDPEQLWMGTALSSFGIVYNSDVYENILGLPYPTGFEDLTLPELRGWVVPADPRQSGSITTTFDSILGNHGWTEGWAILRAMSGNTRYFTSSSTKPPTDVSQGDAAAGLAIDFYGRGQAQHGGRGRVGYVDPAGAVYIDADPITLLKGAPNPEMAKRLIEFCLTEEAQALWQFHALKGEAGQSNPVSPDSGEAMGPQHYELRRMPVRRVMYEKYWDDLMDQVNPFEIASDVTNPGWRTGVQVMMGCFAIDSADECRAAWNALCQAEADPEFPPDVAARMREMYFAWPTTPVALLDELDEDGNPVLDDEGNPKQYESFSKSDVVLEIPWTQETYSRVRNSWRKPAGAETRAKIYYTKWFRDQYRKIVRMHRTGELAQPAGGSS